ncbi:MAG: hypothetical protein AAGF81_07290 [Pseudomonadota bacterium]
MSTFFLVFRYVCYGALVTLLLGFLGVIVFSQPEMCSSFSTGAISCRTPAFEELAKLTMGLLLVSVFTGFPVLLALIGLFFAARAAAPFLLRIYRKFRPLPPVPEGVSQSPAARRSGLGRLALTGKILLYAFGAFFLSAIVAGIYEASFR